MKLLSLSITNFRVIRRTQLEFPDSVIGIIGPNGAGKSSIVEAIAWALYGNPAARSSKVEIKSAFTSNSDNCEVELEFEIGGEHYRIKRRLVGSKDRPEVELYRAGRMQSVGSTETRKQVERLLGLDLKGFTTSFLARQQELNALSELAAHKRREHLAGMLGIEKLDRAIDRVKADLRLHGEKAGLIERQLTPMSEYETRLTYLREHIEFLEKQHDRLAGAHRESKARLDKISLAYREHESRKSACSQLSARIAGLQQTADHLLDQVERLRKEIAGLERASSELKKTEMSLQNSSEIRQRFEELKRLQTKAAHHSDLTQQFRRLVDDLDELEKQKQKCRQAIEQQAREYKKIPEDLDRQLETNRQALDKARADWASVNAEVKATQLDLARLDDQIASIRRIGPEAVCDRCHRPFGDDLPAIRDHLNGERRQVAERFGVLEQDLASKISAGEKLKSQVTQLDRMQKRRIQLQSERDSFQREDEALDRQQVQARERQEQTAKQLREIGEVRFDQAEMDRLATRVSHLDAVEQHCQRLRGSLSRLVPAQEELKMTGEKLSAVNSDIKQLRNEFDKIGFDEDTFHRASTDLENVRKQYEEDRDALVNAGKELELARKELELRQQQKAALDKLADELEECRTNQHYGERLQRLFADFRTNVIARIRPRLAELSSELISEMTAGRYNMIDLDEEYNLSVLDSSQYYEVARFSGGEKDLANLCLRLAISLAISESAGLERSFVILDEVFGSQDDSRRDLIFSSLANLKNRFPQMLLVTHIEEIREKVECLIEVERTAAGWSEVKVDGKIV